jgi:hypothetical protein
MSVKKEIVKHKNGRAELLSKKRKLDEMMNGSIISIKLKNFM